MFDFCPGKSEGLKFYAKTSNLMKYMEIMTKWDSNVLTYLYKRFFRLVVKV